MSTIIFWFLILGGAACVLFGAFGAGYLTGYGAHTAEYRRDLELQKDESARDANGKQANA